MDLNFDLEKKTLSDLEEIEALKSVAQALESLEADAIERVLSWANAKYGFTAKSSNNVTSNATHTGVKNEPGNVKAASKSKRNSKKSKSVIKIDKTINLNPAGKISAEEFAAQKLPSNVKLKGLVATYYIREHLEPNSITVEKIAAFFKFVGWPLPANLPNVLAQAGTEGWLDTADTQDIQITSSGETMVEHKLPKTSDGAA